MIRTDLKTHPAADIFPLLEGPEFEALVLDIIEHGQREPIVVHDGAILDGRNRYRACQSLGIEPVTKAWDGEDTPEAFVVSMNLHRRHLNESQRAMIAARISKLPKGHRPDVEIPTCTQAEAARLLNVDRGTVIAARIVQNEGTPEQVAAVEQGRAAVTTTARVIRGKPPQVKKKKSNGDPLSTVGKNPERIERLRVRAEIWGRIRDTLTHLTSLPLPADVVPIAREMDKVGHVDARLESALKWLKEFSNGWCNRDENAS